MFGDHAVGNEQRLRPLLSDLAQGCDWGAALNHCVHLVGQALSITWRKFKSGVADDFAEAADIGNDDQSSSQHLLDGGEASGLFPN